jgi:putative Ca2+/H+ antiporter (TMEM165/GDT1 family)
VFRHFVVTYVTIFLAELPDKTMFATLLLATQFRRRLPVWIGVTVGYTVHVAIAVAFGSVLARLPERPIQLVVGALFILGGVLTWRAGGEEASAGRQWSRSMSAFRVAWTAASVILVAEFADLTQLATAGFAARFDDPLAVFVGAAAALASVSGLAVIAGSWLTTRVPLRVIQRAAAVLFVVIGVVTLVGALA